LQADQPVRQQVHLETERHEARDISTDAEESDVAEAQLPRIAEQQVEAHGGNDEDAGHDQHVQDIQIRQPERHRGQEKEPGGGEGAVLPTSRALGANGRVGLTIRRAMRSRNPMPSGKREETKPAPSPSMNPRMTPPMVAPGMLPSPPRMTMAKALSEARSPMVGVTRKTGPSKAPAAAASPEPNANVAV